MNKIETIKNKNQSHKLNRYFYLNFNRYSTITISKYIPEPFHQLRFVTHHGIRYETIMHLKRETWNGMIFPIGLKQWSWLYFIQNSNRKVLTFMIHKTRRNVKMSAKNKKKTIRPMFYHMRLTCNVVCKQSQVEYFDEMATLPRKSW